LPADPCTISRQVTRVLGFAACAVEAVGIAGIIDSRKGNATAAPAPRSTVRREMCFFVMNILLLLMAIVGAVYDRPTVNCSPPGSSGTPGSWRFPEYRRRSDCYFLPRRGR